MERNRVEKAKKWQEDRANAAYATRVDNLALAGLQIVGAQAGRILCNFLVPKHLAEEVDIEATTSAHVGQLSYVTVEIRKKGSREMVAVGKQWMASTGRVLSKL
eukprot:TRINITY_DN33021_c0_g1_i14.p1 TRINITY_DN33021_c0_g1~~TRINITY_DN33021_c0_g1_i14.p1  ORF type:complete len:104 (+),score=15.44 TRINITY_DN33021_c0_g1_i14:210-521(+)